MKILDKAYDPKLVEERWSRFWIEEGLFTPEVPRPNRSSPWSSAS